MPEKKKGQAVDAMFCIRRLAPGEGTGGWPRFIHLSDA